MVLDLDPRDQVVRAVNPAQIAAGRLREGAVPVSGARLVLLLPKVATKVVDRHAVGGHPSSVCAALKHVVYLRLVMIRTVSLRVWSVVERVVTVALRLEPTGAAALILTCTFRTSVSPGASVGVV